MRLLLHVQIDGGRSKRLIRDGKLERAVIERLVALFPHPVNSDGVADMGGHREADGIGTGGFGKARALASGIAEITAVAQRRGIGISRKRRIGLAASGVGVTQRQAGSVGPCELPERLEAMAGFFEAVTELHDQMKGLPTGTVRKLLKMGAKMKRKKS